ncbi:MAG: PAS domain-containing protein [Methylotenera sp.]|nr:PAS domain-containing protein [Oligoflexia bacterium]
MADAPTLADLIIDTLASLVIVSDREGRIVRFNPACEAATGYRAAEVLNRIFWDLLLLPEDRENIRKVLGKVTSGDFPQSFENHWVAKDGSLRWIEWRNTCSLNPDGSVQFIIGMGIDATQRKAAEAERTRAQKQYLDLVNSVNGMVWEADVDPFHFTFMSDQSRNILGYSVERWTQEPDFWLAHIHVDDRERVERTHRKATSACLPHTIDYRMIAADGQAIWLRNMVSVICENKKAIAQRGIMIDVTDEKDTQETLRSTSDQFKFALSAAAIGAWDWNLAGDGKVRWLGKTEEMLEQDPKFFDGTIEGFLSLVLPEDREAVSTALAQGLEKRAPYCVEYRLRRKNGQIAWHLSRGQVLVNQNGKPERMSGIVMDISDRKRGEDEKSRALEATQKALQLREDFISIASHELKTPITPLKVGLQILRRAFTTQEVEGLRPEKLKQLLDISDQQLNRLIGLVDNLLDVSKMRTDKMKLMPVRIDLTEIVKEVIQRLEPEVNEARASLTSTLEPAIFCECDPSRIEQVVTNLITNAIKYGNRSPIHLKLHRTSESAVLSIQDQGIGIGKADHDRIFRRFERAASSTHFAGLGLGLYITAQIIGAHHGRIEVTSDAGQGSTFKVTLPLSQPT